MTEVSVQELLGHRDVTTTMISTHVLNRGGLGVRSPMDRLPRVDVVTVDVATLRDYGARGNVAANRPADDAVE